MQRCAISDQRPAANSTYRKTASQRSLRNPIRYFDQAAARAAEFFFVQAYGVGHEQNHRCRRAKYVHIAVTTSHIILETRGRVRRQKIGLAPVYTDVTPMMVRGYSNDLRVRVIQVVESGVAARAAARQFVIGDSTAIRWVKRWRETGSFEAKS